MRVQLSPLKEWMAGSAMLLGRAARAVDRAIRRLEDRHRGPLPYMRRDPAADHAEFSPARILRELVVAARDAELAALNAIRAGQRQQADAPGRLRRAGRRLKALSDELATLTTGFCGIGQDAAFPPAGAEADSTGRPRGEPVWAAGLSRRFGRFVAVAEQWTADGPPASDIGPLENAVRPSRPRPLRPRRPDLP